MGKQRSPVQTFFIPSTASTVNFTAVGGDEKVTLNVSEAPQDAAGANLAISLDGEAWTALSNTAIISGNAMNGAYLSDIDILTSGTVDVLGLTSGVKYYFKA